MITPGFSLNYGGKKIESGMLKPELIGSGLKYRIDERLDIYLEQQEMKEFGGIYWVLNFENPSSEKSEIITDILDCDIVINLPLSMPNRPGFLPKKGYMCVRGMKGVVGGGYYNDNDRVSATEYELQDNYLLPNVTRNFNNRGGRSSQGVMPFFNLNSNGGGAMVAIGWTGDWKASFKRVTNDSAFVKTGLQNAAFYLKPGEKIRTTSVLIMEYTKEEDYLNKFRKLIGKYFSHYNCTPAVREGIFASELWGGLSSEEMVKRINEMASHGIKIEDYWIDAGWYGRCKNCDESFSGDWGAFTGEWEINKRVHPDDFLDVKKACEQAGAHMMLWFEPERTALHLPEMDEHPEWFLSRVNNEGKTDGTKILYYGEEGVIDRMYNIIAGYIKNLNISCYRQDFNIELTKFFEQHDEENRRGITEIKHITGMYRLWDKLINDFPGLVIDNCSSGGHRFDIETFKRSIAFFRSDYQCGFNMDADVVQTHNCNFSKYFPFGGCTTKCVDSMYSLRSAYSPSYGVAYYNAIFQEMDEEKFELAKKSGDEFLRIRRFLSHDFYNLGTSVFDKTSWAVWQYNIPEEKKGIIIAFRREESPFGEIDLELKGMTKGAKVRFRNCDDGSCFEAGANIKLKINEKHKSVLLEYEEI